MKKCVHCYAETFEGAEICKECGSDKFFVGKESTIACPHCGVGNKEARKECYACGHQLSEIR